jgi:hypothetical protein
VGVVAHLAGHGGVLGDHVIVVVQEVVQRVEVLEFIIELVLQELELQLVGLQTVDGALQAGHLGLGVLGSVSLQNAGRVLGQGRGGSSSGLGLLASLEGELEGGVEVLVQFVKHLEVGMLVGEVLQVAESHGLLSLLLLQSLKGGSFLSGQFSLELVALTGEGLRGEGVGTVALDSVVHLNGEFGEVGAELGELTLEAFQSLGLLTDEFLEVRWRGVDGVDVVEVGIVVD